MRQKATERRDLRRLAAASAVLLGAVVMIHNVAAIYIDNTESFVFELNQLFLVTLVPFLALTIGLLVLALVLRGILLRVFAYSLAFIAVLAWIYSNFVVWEFGLLGGGEWDFSPVDEYSNFEIVGLIVIWFALYGLVIKKCRIVTTFIVLLNIVLAVPTALALLRDPNEASLAPRDNLEAFYRLSDRKNTLIVVMDAFQSDLFDDILREDPALAEKFAGFSNYPDTLGVAATTYLSLPSIHTGRVYQVGDNVREFYISAIREDSFLNALTTAGHEVTLVNAIQGVCPEKIELCIESDEVLHGKTWLVVMEAMKLIDLSVFRAVPLSHKRAFYNGQAWVVAPAVRRRLSRFDDDEPAHIAGNRVLKALGERGRVVTDPPTTKFIHLLSTHWPHVLDADCRLRQGAPPEERTAALIQARCAVKDFVGLLDDLRRAGIYDSSLIFLIADTGASFYSSYIAPDSYNAGWPQLVGRANPLFLVKPPGASGALSEATSSIQTSDLAATVCAVLGDCAARDGVSVLDSAAVPSRSRNFKLYHWRHELWGQDALPNLRNYQVDGPLWDHRSWRDYDDLWRASPDSQG